MSGGVLPPGDAPPPDYTIVVPTIGRPSLGRLLEALAAGRGPAPASVIVVDDRREPATRARQPLGLPTLDWPVQVLVSGGRGPAAARNTGWRAATTAWVAFLDDDVVPGADWRDRLAADLAGRPWVVAGSQGRIRVPLPTDRRPTDWERNVAGLETARWITADMAYRRDVLIETGGFDERFRRAFREDAEIALRITWAGYVIEQGERTVAHPPGPAGRWVSLKAQAGNFDDTLMGGLHGAGWRSEAGAGPARNGRHALATASALAAGASLAGRRPLAAGLAGAAWAASTAAFAAGRIRPGPRSPAEVVTMVATSAAIPPVAMWHSARGWLTLPRRLADGDRAPNGVARSPLALDPPRVRRRPAHRARPGRVDAAWSPEMILFDRDGTLIVDVPANQDPDRVVPMPGARAAVRRAREEGLRVGVVTNQAAVGRGVVSREAMAAIHDRIEEIFGSFDTWQICPHTPEDSCACRKPQPGLVRAACRDTGLRAAACAVVGDVGSDVGAARAAGARSVLVPTTATRPAEIESAPVVAETIGRAVDLVLAGMC